MCAINPKHRHSFRNARYSDDSFTITGEATDGTYVTLNFVPERFCDGTLGDTTVVCRLERSEWGVAREHAIANTHYFHVHYSKTDTRHATNASLCFFSNP